MITAQQMNLLLCIGFLAMGLTFGLWQGFFAGVFLFVTLWVACLVVAWETWLREKAEKAAKDEAQGPLNTWEH